MAGFSFQRDKKKQRIFIKGLTRNLRNLDDEAKTEILGNIKKLWSESIKFQFRTEGVGKWRELSTGYSLRKEREGFGDFILQRSRRNKLSTRWANATRINIKQNSISLNYPRSANDSTPGEVARAHQLGAIDRLTRQGTPNPLPSRRLVKARFEELGKQEVERYFGSQ